MSNYIPHYTKKLRILRKEVNVMLRLNNQPASEEKLISAAERIRDARVRVLRAKRALFAPVGTRQDAFDAVDAKIAEVLALTAQQILEDYR